MVCVLVLKSVFADVQCCVSEAKLELNSVECITLPVSHRGPKNVSKSFGMCDPVGKH